MLRDTSKTPIYHMDLDRKTAPKVTDFEQLSIPKCRRLTLDNGINLNIIDHGEFDVNRLTMSWIGGANDVDSFSTLMLASELTREGSKLYSGTEIAETFDFNGAWLKSEYHSHHSTMVLHSLNRRLSHVLPTLIESISHPSFPTQEFEINREKMAKRKELNLTKVAYLSKQSNQVLIYGKNHPCAFDESPQDVRNICINDVKSLHSAIFNANNCELFLAGRITPQIEDLINNFFCQLETTAQHLIHRTVPLNPEKPQTDFIDVPNSMQSAITMSIPTISRNHSDYIDLRYTIMALGGYFGSRLMTNIREDKGYTYGISAALLGNWEGGVATISTQCDNSYTFAVINEIKKEIKNLTHDNFDDEELNRLKHYAMTQVAATLDSPFSIMDYYENMRHVLTPSDYFEEMQHSIQSLTSKKIAQLASKYLNVNELRISIARNPNISE